ncbi:hypothetical protein COO60DRAFT_1550663 [Scenedesmus sp. NREL 46B-D3]|nr:hypothetical protein COO60DRAFT_1550663 [Scenedesmus sp. NREL 46B-D3]
MARQQAAAAATLAVAALPGLLPAVLCGAECAGAGADGAAVAAVSSTSRAAAAAGGAAHSVLGQGLLAAGGCVRASGVGGQPCGGLAAAAAGCGAAQCAAGCGCRQGQATRLIDACVEHAYHSVKGRCQAYMTQHNAANAALTSPLKWPSLVAMHARLALPMLVPCDKRMKTAGTLLACRRTFM